MLVHHSDLDYAVAATEASNRAKDAMNAQIQKGQAQAETVIQSVFENVPIDRVVRGAALKFKASDNGVSVGIPLDQVVEETLHRNALNQAASRAEIPTSYVNDLISRGEWGRNLAAQNLNEMFSHLNGDRFLLRSVNGQVRGFLSDSYRRLDSRPILDAFLGAVREFGAVPVEALSNDVKVSIKVVLPVIFEPIPNEPMLIGAEWENSDFGCGAQNMNTFVDRLWCTNFARSESLLHKIHLGARLGDNLGFSQRTYDLDTETMASAVTDMMKNALSADSVNKYVDLVKSANEQKVEGREVAEYLKKNLTKTEAEVASTAFNSADVEQLPAGNTRWRFSNALSFLAKSVENPVRALEIQRMAGQVIEKKA